MTFSNVFDCTEPQYCLVDLFVVARKVTGTGVSLQHPKLTLDLKSL